MIGNIGNGKSATINKMMHWLTKGHTDKSYKMEKVVVSKAAVESVTLGASDRFGKSIHNGDFYRLIDT
jgi:hypothetical protein